MEGSNSLGPLTTVFTMAASCSEDLNSFYSISTGYVHYFAQGNPDMSTCFPSGYGKYAQDYYSPGVCPDGYTVACSSQNSIGSLTETVQTCCPTHLAYTCYPSPGNTAEPWHSTQGCAASFTPGKSIDFTYYYGITGGSTVTLNPTTSGDGGAINAFSVQVRFQSTDFATTSTSSPSSTVAVLTSSPTTAAPAATSSTTSDNSSSNAGLSVGASAGIGVASAVAVITFISGLLFFILGRRRRRLHTNPTPGPEQPGAEETHDQRLGEISELDQRLPNSNDFKPQNEVYGHSPQYVAELPAPKESTHEMMG